MQVPNLPTDSLYKFIFISGIVLILFSFYLYSNKSNDLQNHIDNTNNQIALYNEQFQILEEQIENFKEQSIRLSIKNNITNPIIINDTSFIFIPEYTDDEMHNKIVDIIGNNYSNILEQRHNFKLLSAKVTHSNKMIKVYDSRLLGWKIIVYILGILGGIIVGSGYSLWYNRLQRPIDKEYALKLSDPTRFQENCQSCGINLSIQNEKRGTEKDDTLNRCYCINCYSKGVYTNPNYTFEDMWKSLLPEFEKRKYKKIQKKYQKKKIRNLYRWRAQREWF